MTVVQVAIGSTELKNNDE